MSKSPFPLTGSESTLAQLTWKRQVKNYVARTIVVVLGTLISVGSGWVVSQQLANRAQESLIPQAKTELHGLSQSVQIAAETLDALRRLVRLRPHLTREEFYHFMERDSLDRRGVRMVGWAPRVPLKNRDNFIRRKRANGLFDFDIRDADPTAPDQLVPAPRRAVHYPLSLAEPVHYSGHMLGMDMAVAPEMDLLLQQARQKGGIWVSHPMALPSSENELIGLRFIRAVRDEDDQLLGFGLVEMGLKDLLARAIPEADLQSHRLEIMDMADGTPIMSAGPSLSPTRLEWLIPAPAPAPPQWEGTLEVGQQTWIARFTATDQSLSQPLWLVPAASLSVVILACLILLWLIQQQHRTHAIETLIARRTAALAQANAELSYQASYDPLTGCLNRHGLENVLQSHFDETAANSDQSGSGFAFLLIDLDRFKLINDTRGHHAGDKALIAVTKRLQSKLTQNDALARLGGDEFAIVAEMDTSEPERGSLLARKILDSLRAPVIVEGESFSLSASIGVVTADESGATPEELLRRADLAMYESKHTGRARHTCFSSALLGERDHLLRIETELQHALKRHQLFMVYQPVVDVATGSRIGVEALMRWTHPELGIIRPDIFIPMAEEAGLIANWTPWLLDQVLSDLRPHLKAESFIAHINLSPVQLREPLRFQGQLLAACHQHGVPPQALAFELTETAIVSGTDRVWTELEGLLALGTGVLIDDFGTGFASLAQLPRLKWSGLKIDRSFVHLLGQGSEEGKRIMQAMLLLGSGFPHGVVAEGIETPAQAKALLALGCRAGQGYLFGRPMEAEGLKQVA